MKLCLAENLRFLAKERNVALTLLAKSTEVPPATLHGWLFGRHPTNLRAIKRIAAYFSLSVDELCFSDLADPSTRRRLQSLVETSESISIGNFDVLLIRPKS